MTQEIKQLPRMLNLGSGNRKRPQEEGWINIDIDKTCNSDIVRDLDNGLPFEDNSVDRVYCSHTIEHVKDIYFFMYEIWRVCKPDALIEIIAPNHAHLMSIYPNHKRFLRPQYFDCWKPKEMYLNTTMNYEYETYGAEFLSLNESIIENSGAIRFVLQTIKNESLVKKDLIEKGTDGFYYLPNPNIKPIDVKKEKKEKRILNIGCGPKHYIPSNKDEEVINIDKEPFWKPNIIRDVEKGLPFDDNSVDEIFTSHFLEHITQDKMDFFMFECWRVLKNKGKFICIVPIGKSWMSSPYHKSPMTEMTPIFFTEWNHPEITGYNYKNLGYNITTGEVDGKKVDWADELHFGLEAIK